MGGTPENCGLMGLVDQRAFIGFLQPIFDCVNMPVKAVCQDCIVSVKVRFCADFVRCFACIPDRWFERCPVVSIPVHFLSLSFLQSVSPFVNFFSLSRLQLCLSVSHLVNFFSCYFLFQSRPRFCLLQDSSLSSLFFASIGFISCKLSLLVPVQIMSSVCCLWSFLCDWCVQIQTFVLLFWLMHWCAFFYISVSAASFANCDLAFAVACVT